MTDTPPDLTADRLALIAAGGALPGHEGAFWRLMGKMDHSKIADWLNGEKLRGTSPDDIFDVSAQVVAAICFMSAMSVERQQVRAAARDIMGRAVKVLDHDINSFLERSKKKNALMLPDGFRVIDGDQK